VHHVCAPSTFALRSYLADGYFAGVASTVLPNSVPADWGDPALAAAHRAADPRRATVTSFLLMSRLDHHKAVGCLLAALDLLPDLDVRLHVAGDGVLAPMCWRHTPPGCP
jgi:hypothetical protein